MKTRNHTDDKLGEILEACLSDIKAGRATREECLSRYKDHARELEPLLRVATSLSTHPKPRPSEKRVFTSRQRILQEFHSKERIPWFSGLRRSFTAPALAFSTVLTFIIMSFFGARVYFSTVTDEPTASAYPNLGPVITQTVPPQSEPTIAFNGIGLPGEQDGPYEIASAPDGTLWFARTDATRVGSVSAEDGKVQDWPLAANEGRAAGITVDKNGRVWFTVSSSQSVIALDPSTNEVSSWRVPPGDGTLGRIEAGEDGHIWFIARDGSRIYALDPKTDNFTAYDVNGAEYIEWADDSLWFSGKGELGRIAPDGQVQVYDAPGDPAALVWDGSALWYAGGSLIGRFDAATDQVVVYPLENKTADRIATDGLKNIWFGSQGGTELGVLQSDSGQISTRSMSAVVQNLYWLAVGTDQVWMSDGDSQFVYSFSLTKSGEVSFSVPINTQDQLVVSIPLAALPAFH